MWGYFLKFGLAMIFLCGALKDLRRCFAKYFSVDHTLTKHSVADVEVPNSRFATCHFCKGFDIYPNRGLE